MKTTYTGMDEYEFANGSKPKGQGSWIFEATGVRNDAGAYTSLGSTTHNGTFAQAKAAAKKAKAAEAREAGCDELILEVQP